MVKCTLMAKQETWYENHSPWYAKRCQNPIYVLPAFQNDNGSLTAEKLDLISETKNNTIWPNHIQTLIMFSYHSNPNTQEESLRLRSNKGKNIHVVVLLLFLCAFLLLIQAILYIKGGRWCSLVLLSSPSGHNYCRCHFLLAKTMLVSCLGTAVTGLSYFWGEFLWRTVHI